MSDETVLKDPAHPIPMKGTPGPNTVKAWKGSPSWDWNSGLALRHQPALAGAMGISVVGSSEHETPGSSWPVNPGNSHWHCRWLDQDTSRSWGHHSQWISPGQRPEPFQGHTNHLVGVYITLSYLRGGRNQIHISHPIGVFICDTPNCLSYSKHKYFQLWQSGASHQPTGQFWQLPFIIWSTVYVYENCMFLPYCFVKMSTEWKTGWTDTSDFKKL